MAGSSVEVRPELKAQLESLATQTRRDEFELANEALATYLAREKANLARIREGLEQAKRGEFATDEEIRAFFAKHAAPRA